VNINHAFKYIRIQGREKAYRTGKPLGIFVAADHLGRSGLLTDNEKAVYNEITNVWFEENLPNPPFYDDDNPGKPITWFKTATTAHMVEKLKPLMEMLEKYAKPYDVVYSNFPGRIVYEDEWQVAVYDDNAPGRISDLSTEHLPMYAEIIRQSFTTVANDYGLTMENCPAHTSFITNERLAERLDDNYYPFGYFANGKLIGFVSLLKKSRDVYEMSNLAVLPDYRHLGYGKALVEFCKKKVTSFGGSKIVLSIVESSDILKTWYEENGFNLTETKTFDHMPFPVGYMEFEIV
jgi:ribosomal protein S18 acetylase RimI-like enzyme